LEPYFGKYFKSLLADQGISSSLATHICQGIQSLNKKITEDNNLGAGFQIGHSYFCSFANGQDEENWFNDVMDFEIKPLLEEIWFDDPQQVKRLVSELTDGYEDSN
ncbi:MAG: hypothetical protein WD491_14200, partial [Balneolales bacterium]